MGSGGFRGTTSSDRSVLEHPAAAGCAGCAALGRTLAIVGGLLITLIYTLNYHLGLVERQETVTVATFLAKDKLDDIEGDPENSKGYFEAPYEEYAYETSVKESQYPGISEIIVSVNKGNEEVKLNEFVIK